MAIAKQTQRFVRDPFANYVIQYVLGLKMKYISKEVGAQLLGSLLELSLEKFSSNVIEKCLEATTEEIRYKMVAEIASAPSFQPYLLDQYANYVIQKALQVCEEPLFTQFIDRIKLELPQLAISSDFGFKIHQRLVRQYGNRLGNGSEYIPNLQKKPSNQNKNAPGPKKGGKNANRGQGGKK